MTIDNSAPSQDGTASDPIARRHASRRRLSPARVLLALGVAAGAAVITSMSVNRALQPDLALPDPWFAPYVDVTLTPLHDFENGAANPSDDIVLSFVVADDDNGCTPTWGNYVDLDEAATALDLDRRIALVRQRDGDVLVSFGGAANTELAVACEDIDELADAYDSVVDRYSLTTIDLDIEGTALSDVESVQRRAEAIAKVQQARRDDGAPLAVWLTLPATSGGLSADGVAVVDAMLDAGVDVGGVNLMTMNFGDSLDDFDTPADATIAALRAAHRQLDSAYQRADLPLADTQIWRKLGATPMIGRNDIESELFTLDDAEAVADFAQKQGLGRLSLWSLNRDVPCGPNVDPRRTSDHCTGLDQDPFDFVEALDVLPGRPSDGAGATTVADDTPPIVDDPATSPYPIWRADRGYDEGAKVVWRGSVYQAKWWTQGDLPDEPIVDEWETPWTLLGPVLPDDRPAPTPTPLPDGTYPEWSDDEVYEEGDRVLLDGYAYEAKWWTEGDRPDEEVSNSWDTPWQPLAENAWE
ncbi:MAG: hypothetical protein KDB21_17665 [Acidimicrobiales bacterium]|nr:hypothetical protein [Acidimicrobiales bacterium]